jgi:NAD(P)-dependent dehydrogenase (short-subunit alcohol dehydrogenase family)
MRVVVITGSTRGIGFGLAQQLLERGCALTISGRSQESVQAALQKLAADYPAERLLGQPCDVTDYQQLVGLWEAAVARFGRVDIWINNAGISNPRQPVWQQSPEVIANVIDTNLKGVIYGCRLVAEKMLAQGGGALYNMEGLGSDGRRVPGLVLYGTTKYGLHYFTDSLIQEAEGTSLVVGSLSPGMVATDMLSGEEQRNDPDWERTKRVMNILSDRVETVTPWLADQVLANQANGARIKWLTRGKILGRFLQAPFHKRQVID